MTIRRKLQLVYVLIMLSTVGIGVLAVWSVASWQKASESLTYSHVQGERLERVRGDIYRQVKEVIDWLTLEDKDADEEFRSLAAVINDELDAVEAETKTAEERLAIENLGGSYGKVFAISRMTQEAVEIYARDEGLGVSTDILNMVFDPYFTTKPDGVGLGLAMAKKVMNANQGTIELHSEQGRGTTVTLRYPLSSFQEA